MCSLLLYVVIFVTSAQRLLSRRTRTTLPVCKQLLKPAAKTTASVKAQLTKKQSAQKRFYDKTSKLLVPLTPNQVVRLQTQKGHDKMGVVRKKCDEPRSYMVESEGKEYRRNRRHILPVLEPQPPKPIIHESGPDVTQHATELQRDETQMTEKPDNTELTPSGQCQKQTHAEKTPSKVLEKCVVVQNKNLVQPTTSMYLTRSGRVSKPNAKYLN